MNYSRRLDIIESGDGRRGGWYVECDGERLAALVDVRFADMFWDSYRLDILTADPAKRNALFTAAFWLESELIFRSMQFGDVAPRAIPSLIAADTLRSSGRIEFRGLRLPAHRRPWDWVAIKVRRLWRVVRGRRSRKLRSSPR